MTTLSRERTLLAGAVPAATAGGRQVGGGQQHIREALQRTLQTAHLDMNLQHAFPVSSAQTGLKRLSHLSRSAQGCDHKQFQQQDSG